MPELIPPDWNRCPGAAVCLALHNAQDSSRDALVVAQAQTIDRLTPDAVEVARLRARVAELEAVVKRQNQAIRKAAS